MEFTDESVQVQNVKALYAAMKVKDVETVKSLLTTSPSWDVSPGFPEGAIYQGMAEVFGQFYPRLRSRVYSFAALPDRFIDADKTVVVLGHYRIVAADGDNPNLVRFAHVWTISADGRIDGVYQIADSASFPVH